MLSMIDQHWREHLYEMDYLREGINLRAMGQKDPLAEWQREGFDMFEAMMGQIQDNFVALRLAPPGGQGRGGAARRRTPTRMRYSSSDDAVQGAAALRAAAAGIPAEDRMGDFDPAIAGRGRRCAGGRRGGRPAAGAGGEDPGPQRAVLLRERQEVQALPRPLSAAAPACSACATSPTTSPSCAAASTAAHALPPGRRRRARGSPSSRSR